MNTRVIYADNAATTRLDNYAFDAMKKYLLEEYANPSAKYSFSRLPARVIKEARNSIALCIGANHNEIFFTSGGTEGNNWIIKEVICFDKNAHIITSCIEHHAVLQACSSLEQKGYSVTYLPVNKYGQVDESSLKKAIRPETKLVSIMMANNEIGTMQNISSLAKIAHSRNILFHTDAVQAVGHIPIDVKRLDVDFLTASAHKFNGTKGTGFVYVRNGIEINPFLEGGSQEMKKRAGTENVAGIVAMSVALEKNCQCLKQYKQSMDAVVELFLDELRKRKVDFIINGSETSLPGLVSVSFKNVEGEMILHRLDLKGIYVSTGAACNSKDIEQSHVLKAIEVPREYINGTIRVSFGRDNTTEHAAIIANEIADILKR